MVHCGGLAASLLLSGCLISPEAGDRKIWVMVLAVGSRLSPSRLAGQETTTKGCVGVQLLGPYWMFSSPIGTVALVKKQRCKMGMK